MDDTTHTEDQISQNDLLEQGVEDSELQRRDVLNGMGRFAYAAPALALLAQPRAAQADYGGGRGGVRDSGGAKLDPH